MVKDIYVLAESKRMAKIKAKIKASKVVGKYEVMQVSTRKTHAEVNKALTQLGISKSGANNITRNPRTAKPLRQYMVRLGLRKSSLPPQYKNILIDLKRGPVQDEDLRTNYGTEGIKTLRKRGLIKKDPDNHYGLTKKGKEYLKRKDKRKR